VPVGTRFGQQGSLSHGLWSTIKNAVRTTAAAAMTMPRAAGALSLVHRNYAAILLMLSTLCGRRRVARTAGKWCQPVFVEARIHTLTGNPKAEIGRRYNKCSARQTELRSLQRILLYLGVDGAKGASKTPGFCRIVQGTHLDIRRLVSAL